MRKPMTLLVFLTLVSAPCATAATPKGADCGWIGCGIGDGICARLAAGNTGVNEVERTEIAEVLRLRHRPPVEEDCANPAEREEVMDAVQHQEIRDTRGLPTLTASALM